jgi:hypothetical protein
LRRVIQEIQVADYELHAAMRILANAELDSEHIVAFMDASIRRDRMMARVLSYLAEIRTKKAYKEVYGRNGNGRL